MKGGLDGEGYVMIYFNWIEYLPLEFHPICILYYSPIFSESYFGIHNYTFCPSMANRDLYSVFAMFYSFS